MCHPGHGIPGTYQPQRHGYHHRPQKIRNLPSEAFDGAWGELPWVDMWLPATLPSIYVLPSIAVQQTKQGDEHSSLKFARGCVVHSFANATPTAE